MYEVGRFVMAIRSNPGEPLSVLDDPWFLGEGQCSIKKARQKKSLTDEGTEGRPGQIVEKPGPNRPCGNRPSEDLKYLPYEEWYPGQIEENHDYCTELLGCSRALVTKLRSSCGHSSGIVWI